MPVATYSTFGSLRECCPDEPFNKSPNLMNFYLKSHDATDNVIYQTKETGIYFNADDCVREFMNG